MMRRQVLGRKCFLQQIGALHNRTLDDPPHLPLRGLP